MSRNLVELVRRGPAAPTALERLTILARRDGSVTPEHVRAVAAETGLPEATVHGIATFYDDLTAPHAPRDVRVCTGTACFAACGDAHVRTLEAGLGLALGEARDGVALTETVCLGLCHSAPAVRVGDVVDAGPGALERALAGASRPAAEPPARSVFDEPILLRAGGWDALPDGRAMTPEALTALVEAAELRGRGGAMFPAATKWQLTAREPGPDKVVVANGDEGDPGSYIDKHLMERCPDLLLEGMALVGHAVGARQGYVLLRSEYPDADRALRAAIDRARAAGHLDERFDVEVVLGAGSYVVGEETALLASLQGLRGQVSARPPYPAQRGVHGLPTVVHNVETLCNVPGIVRMGAEAYRGLSPGATAGSKLICFNERFQTPGVVEVPFGLPVSELCADLGGGLVDGHEIKAVQIGGPLAGILPASLLGTRLDLAPLAEVGCMVGHGSILAFDERTDMRAVAEHLLAFGAHESCGKCFPCRVGLTRAHELVAADAPVDRASLEALLETLELGSLCAHGGGMPAPIRSLIAHFPEELRLT